MLNTTIHNPAVKDKPSVERFITMNRGINDGGNLPDELLKVRHMLNLCLSVHSSIMKRWKESLSSDGQQFHQ